MRVRKMLACAAAAALGLGVLVPAAWAQEDPAPPAGWTDTAELSYVMTGGNSEASSFGFKNTLGREWERSSFKLRAGGLRVETTTTSRTAIAPDPGNLSDFFVDEDDTTTKTAENYFLNGRYDRKITDRFFWYAGAGWDRNVFAGIDNRYTGVGGVGNIWLDREDMKFKTDYALTFTKQEDVIEVLGVDDTFLGLRFSWDYLNKLGANTVYTNSLVIDENLDETSDWRADMLNTLAVSMNSRLALAVGLQLLYDNEPSFTLAPLESPAGSPTGTSVPVELDELDTIFTVSLVINF